MLTCVNVCTRALCVGVAAVSLVGALEAARADDCLTEPNRTAGPGARWLYHVDRATNRKCWFLTGAGAQAPRAEPPGASPYDPPAPSLGSLFSGWTLGLGSPAQPDSASGDARAAPSPRPDDQRTDVRPRPARQPHAEAALAAKPHRPSPAPPPVAHAADAEPQSRLSPTERDALFRAFLHWQEQKPQ